MRSLVVLAVLAGAALAISTRRRGVQPRPRLGPPPPDEFRVRDAGPEEMRDPPRRWDEVDEQEDESFPASDPPANY